MSLDPEKWEKKLDELSLKWVDKKLNDPSMQDDIYRKRFEKYSRPVRSNKFKNSKLGRSIILTGWIVLALILGLISAR